MLRYFKKKLNTLRNLTLNRECGYIYMLHRVGYQDDSKLFANENMKVSPEFLEAFIQNKQKTHQFISIDDLCRIKEGKMKLSKKFILMTLDDGYLDNYELALPVFKKYNIPFVIYIASGLIDGIAMLWWYKLEELILKNNCISTGDGKSYPCETIEQKEQVFLELRTKILDIDPVNFKAEIINMLPEIAQTTDYYELMMNRDQINQISNEPLCTIGAHTVGHFNLKNLSDILVIEDIKQNKQTLKDITGKDIMHFAYPFGTANEVGDKTEVIAARAGFKTITIAYGGSVRKQEIDLFNLKRMMLMEERL